MYRQGNVILRAAWLPASFALALAGLLAGAAAAAAAPGRPAVTPLAAASGPAVAPTAFTAPVYSCTITAGGRAVHRTSRIPITLRSMGPARVGSTDTILFSSPGADLGGPLPAGTSAVSFRGALPVTGAQTGSIPLTGNLANAGHGPVSLRGMLHLSAAGLDHIRPPAQFTVTVHAASLISAVAVCTAQTAMTPAMPAAVTVQATNGTGITPLLAGAAPAGAPSTGGGGSLHRATSLPGVCTGLAVLLAGAGLTVAGLRRRRRSGS